MARKKSRKRPMSAATKAKIALMVGGALGGGLGGGLLVRRALGKQFNELIRRGSAKGIGGLKFRK